MQQRHATLCRLYKIDPATKKSETEALEALIDALYFSAMGLIYHQQQKESTNDPNCTPSPEQPRT